MPNLHEMPPWLLRLFAVFFGLVWGSFLNVVIYRVPRGMSVSRPASHCPSCSKPIAPWRNIPVLSWLLLRGRAPCCGAKISPRYALVEAIGGLLALAIVEVHVLQLPGETLLHHAAAIFVADLALALALVAAAFIDMEHLYIPDGISYGLTALGLATFSLRTELSIVDVLVGAAGSFLVVWLLFGVLYRWVRGRTGMGLGDAKLLMVAGAWFGWQGALFALLAGAVQGTIAAIALLLARGKIEEPEAVERERQQLLQQLESIEEPEERARFEQELHRDPIFEQGTGGVAQSMLAFGPFIALATIEYLLVGRVVLEVLFPWTDG